MPWTTRVHWIWGLILPGRFYFLSLLLSVLVAFIPWTWRWPFVIFLATLGILGFPGILFKWRSFSLTFPPGGNAMIEQNGMVIIAERRINLAMVGSMTFQQTLMGRILDYGSISIGGLGGPFEWENIGQFRALRRIIESQGEWMPPTGNVFFTMLVGWIRQINRLMTQLLRNFRQFVDGLRLEIQIIIESLRTPTYRRFLDFAESILFPQESHRFENWVHMQSLRDSPFTKDEIKIYQGILIMRRLVVSDTQGRTHRHKRIRTPHDISEYVPATWFRKAIRVV